MLFLYGAATLIYLMVGGYLYFCLIKNLPINKPIMLTSIITAMLFHASLLAPQIVTLYGLNLNIFNAISLTSLFFFGVLCFVWPLSSNSKSRCFGVTNRNYWH